jgi:cystathionine beta-lyase
MNQAGQYDFDTCVDRGGTASYKWDKYAGRDVIPLWVADMDFPSPPAVVAALRHRTDHEVFGYSHAPASLYEAIQSSLRADCSWEVPAEWIVWLPGLVSGLNVACRAIGSRGDQVATFTPVYPPFLSAPSHAERGVVKTPLACRKLENGVDRWEMDLDALEHSLTPRTRLLLLCSPHNPVSRAWSEAELDVLADVVRRHDLTVVSDEIHCGLILDAGRSHLPFALRAADMRDRTITLMAPSKTFNIPGLGCSFAIVSDASLRRRFSRAMEGIVPHVNLFGYVAAEAAYRHGEPWRRELVAYLRDNRTLVESEISTMPGLSIAPVEATYLAWIDARETGIDDPAAFFEKAGVGLSDGCEFDFPGFVRLNFGCCRALLTKALGRMRAALEAPHGQ